MFSRKQIIVAAVAILIIVIGFVFFLLSKSNQPAPSASNTTANQQQSGTTSETGGVTEVTPSPIYDGRGNLIVKTDPTQPFAAIQPRAKEPVQQAAAHGAAG